MIFSNWKKMNSLIGKTIQFELEEHEEGSNPTDDELDGTIYERKKFPGLAPGFTKTISTFRVKVTKIEGNWVFGQNLIPVVYDGGMYSRNSVSDKLFLLFTDYVQYYVQFKSSPMYQKVDLKIIE